MFVYHLIYCVAAIICTTVITGINGSRSWAGEKVGGWGAWMRWTARGSCLQWSSITTLNWTGAVPVVKVL